MSVNWLWKDKMGEISCQRGERKYKLNVYSGNCMCVMVYHYTENGEPYYMCHGFFNDAEHLKKCLGLVQGHDNIYEKEWKKWKLNTYFKDSLTLAKLLTQAGYKVELYYKEIK